MKLTNRFVSLGLSTCRFLSLIALLIISETVFAQVVFRAGVDVGIQTNAGTGPDELQKNGVKLYVTQGAFGTSQYRIAKSQTLTVSSDVGNITKIVFTSTADLSKNYGLGGFAYQSGYSWGNETAQWLGDASSVAFTATNNQVRFLKVEVYIDGEEPTGDIDWTSSPEEPLSVEKALELGNQLAIGESSDKPVYVKGVVSEIQGYYGGGEVNYFISDDGFTTSQLYIYYGNYSHNDFQDELGFQEESNDILVNDSIVLVGVVSKYWNNNNPIVEIKNSSLYSLNGFELYKEIDGIYYAVSPRKKTLDVIKNDTIENFYSGDIVIPAVVTIKGTDFAVNSIADEAFAGCENLTSVFVSDGISYIQYRAFAGCIALKSIDLPGSILYIEDEAFSGCNNIKATLHGDAANRLSGEKAISEVVLDETVTTFSFANCTNLTAINIPQSVTNIGEYAFYNCTSLTSITIPNSVTSIGEDAFYGCRGLTSITIPNNVTSIGNSAFSGCNQLSNVTIDSPSIGLWLKGMKSIRNVTIGESVYSVSNGAFQGCDNISSVTILCPSVGAWFSGNKSLGRVELGDSVNNISVGAFRGCSNMTIINIPERVTAINNYSFYGCSGLTSVTIPSSVKSIGSYAFSYCSGLTSVTIPNSVTAIDNSAFFNCTSLYHLNLNCPNVGTWFSRIESLMSIEFGESVTSISSGAFADCYKLYRISIAGNVTTIGDNAFPEYSLREVILDCPVVKSWFKKIHSIEYVEFGDSVTTINANAFYWCSGLETAKGGKNITTIGDYAFSLCGSLKTIEFGNRLRSIGNYAFDRCSSLTSFSNSEGLVSIGNNAFNDCYNLADFDVPEGVTSISDYAFKGCRKMEYINLPNSLKSIGQGAFSGCQRLDYIYIPENVASIGEKAFNGCNLTEVYINCPIVDLWFKGMRSIKTLTIGDSVKIIRDDAFNNCSGITSIEIGNGVTSIGNKAFYFCSSVTSIKIGNGVTAVGNNAFYGCFSVADLSLNCASVGSWFYGNSIKYIEIGDSVKEISDDAFSGFSKLEYVGIKEGLQTIGKRAFYNCSSLLAINIPSSTTVISDEAFYGCSNLMPELGKGLTIIGNRAFYGCKSILYLSIPNSIKHIGNNAFYGCLTEWVYCHLEQPLEDCFPFGKGSSCLLPQGSILYVPNTALEAYKQSPSWNVFTYILPFNNNPDNIEEVSGNANTIIKVYSLSGQYLKTIDAINQLNVVMPPGIYIVGGKKITVK